MLEVIAVAVPPATSLTPVSCSKYVVIPSVLPPTKVDSVEACVPESLYLVA